MSKRFLGRASLAVLAGFAAFSLSACTWGDGDNDRGDGGGFTRHDPPAHWDPGWHDHDRGHDRDRGGRDHDGGRDHERGGRERDRAELTPGARELTTLASLDEKSAGKMFDGSK
jgi:hypothetical protein